MPVNNTEPLSIYKAGPGYAECLAKMSLAATRSHRERGFLDFLTGLPGPKIIQLLAILALHPDQPWGRIGNTRVALVDGVCAGTITFRPETDSRDYPFLPSALEEAARSMGIAPEVVSGILDRQRAFVKHLAVFEEPVPEKTWLVEYLGVRPENRAAGVARGLMARAFEEVAEAGGSHLELYCDIGNIRAERLFASLGFALKKEYRYGPGFAPLGEGVRRLRLKLAG